MKASKITIGRLFSLGNYEHIRYEISIDVPEGESSARVLIRLEKLIESLSPKTHTQSREELARQEKILLKLHCDLSLPEVEFRRLHGHFVGTPSQFYERCRAAHAACVVERDNWEFKSAKARAQLDDLGGVSEFKDAKKDWEDDDKF